MHKQAVDITSQTQRGAVAAQRNNGQDQHVLCVPVSEAYTAFQSQIPAFLIDVRTRAEWAFVGVPLLPPSAHPPIFLEWQSFPDMIRQMNFEELLEEKLQASGAHWGSPLYFLCRSGQRSQAAAQAMAVHGYRLCHNLQNGFEGPPDAQGQRGRIAGWKAEGLPWTQS